MSISACRDYCRMKTQSESLSAEKSRARREIEEMEMNVIPVSSVFL